jgi:hemolysin III
VLGDARGLSAIHVNRVLRQLREQDLLTLHKGKAWAIAILGVLAKMAIPTHFVRTSCDLYLAQGWACLLTLEPLRASISSTAVILLFVGGVLYTVGVVFHL